MDTDIELLSQPLSADAPCGVDLEDTQLLASFDGYRVFGRTTDTPDEPVDPNDPARKPPAADWREIRLKALAALGQSKDFRLLAHVAAANLRLEGWQGYFAAVDIAARWMRDFGPQVYPRIDDDAILRRNALGCFADRMAMLIAMNRLAIIEHRQLGRVSLRDIDAVRARRAPAEGEEPALTEAQMAAVFASAETEVLAQLDGGFTKAIDALQAIDAAMREVGGAQASPDFEPLTSLLRQAHSVLEEQLRGRGAVAGGPGGAADGAAGGPSGGGVISVGAIRSRQDALVALDAVASFFKQNEPSSPVPLLIERARRLVGQSFLDILNDVAPDGLAAARAAGGVKTE